MFKKSLLKISLAVLAITLYGLFLQATWNLEDLKFSARNLAILTPLLFLSSQFLIYFGVHMWTYFKYN